MTGRRWLTIEMAGGLITNFRASRGILDDLEIIEIDYDALEDRHDGEIYYAEVLDRLRESVEPGWQRRVLRLSMREALGRG